MILLSGADLVLPDRVVGSGSLVIEDDRIGDILTTPRAGRFDGLHFDLSGHYIVPGFIDVHVHGVERPRHARRAVVDWRDRRASAAVRRHGVLPDVDGLLARRAATHAAGGPGCADDACAGRRARAARAPRKQFHQSGLTRARSRSSACGAAACSAQRTRRRGRRSVVGRTRDPRRDRRRTPGRRHRHDRARAAGALDLIRDLTAHGHHVSLGHSGATYEEALEGIRAGARHATHLFNRMTPMTHRAPGLTGAVLESEEIIAELVCDGVHVHPGVMRVALAAKRPERVMAITDGTAGSGLPSGGHGAHRRSTASISATPRTSTMARWRAAC